MFASSTTPFTQSSSVPFGSGQTGGAAVSPSPFGSQTGSTIFGGMSTGRFGLAPEATLSASRTPAVGTASSTFAGSLAGQKPSFAGFGSTPSQASQLGTNQCGTSKQPAFGSSKQPAFDASSQPAFGGVTTPAFGSTTTPAFGSTTAPLFGNTGTGFGVSSAPAFDSSSVPAFGSALTPAFGVAPFSQSTSASGSTPSSPFQSQGSPFAGTPMRTLTSDTTRFGQSAFGWQHGGSRVATFGRTPLTNSAGTYSRGEDGEVLRLESISAMPVYQVKSHEELRFEDYQRDNKGGANNFGQQTNTFTKPQSNLFSTSSTPNPFNLKPQTPASSGFSSSSTSIAQSPFNSTTTTNPFCNTQSTSIPFLTPSRPCNSTTNPFCNTQSTSLPFNNTQTTSFPFLTPPRPCSSTTNPFCNTQSTSLPFNNTQSTSFPFLTPPGQTTSAFQQPTTTSFPFLTPPGQTTSAFQQPTTTSFPFLTPPGQTTSAFQQPTTNLFTTSSTGLWVAPLSKTTPSLPPTSTPVSQPTKNPFSTPLPFASNPLWQPTINPFSTSSTGIGTGSLSSTTTSSPLPGSIGQIMPSFLNAFQMTGVPQISSAVNFISNGQIQTGIAGISDGHGSFVSQGIYVQSSEASQSIEQPAPNTNPFGTLPALPRVSVGRSAPLIQYGISSMPVAEPSSVRISSLSAPRHLSQRRIKLPARNYRPKSDAQRVPFFVGDEVERTELKPDAYFVPREDPRSLIVSPIESWPRRTMGEIQSIPKDVHPDNENGGAAEDGHNTELNNSPVPSSEPSGVQVDHAQQEMDTLSIQASGHCNVEAEHGADSKALMPKLGHTDYYTEPRIQELTFKEKVEPGFCRHVKDFTVGRRGYGSIKFCGETDVRSLDIESIVKFNTREVIVYMDESKKPPVGEGLNKPAEVTLLNIKCMNKKTGQQFTQGPKVDKYKEMIMKKTEEQGAEFISYDPIQGEWKFKVDHFSRYGIEDGAPDAGLTQL